MSAPPTVLVYEFFTGGGFPASGLPGGLAAEALGMLWALLVDFRRWSVVRTITVLDPRFDNRVPGLNRNTLPADEVCSPTHQAHREVYRSLLHRCDAVIIIAPETGDVLSTLTKEAEDLCVPVLGSNAQSIAEAGNKAVSYCYLRKAGLPTPEIHSVSFASAARAAGQIGYPLVIKPIDGVGSEGVFRVVEPADLAFCLPLVRQVTSLDQIILQSYVNGIHVSASLLVSKEGCLPLSFNRQLIEMGSPFKYLGSEVPFDHSERQHALELACSAARLIPGLKGYVGVDLILAEDSPQIIEINPRLTTSYIGLRQVTPVNLAAAIWDACITGILPERVPLNGHVAIRKDNPVSWGLRQDRRHSSAREV
jgi:tyramine---L-glutamate ligase